MQFFGCLARHMVPIRRLNSRRGSASPCSPTSLRWSPISQNNERSRNVPLAPEKRIERSADSLQKLYTVIVALSVSQAITSFLKDRDTLSGLGSHESLQAIPALIAFFVTLVPFYHGMNRHLDRCYLERDAGPRQAALLLDFGVFF